MAVGLPAKTTYADGDVFSASDINDTNGTINLIGQTNNFYAGKNRIINGDFFINQRNFTSNTTSRAYNFDRFLTESSGGTVTTTPQTFTTGAAPVAGYEARNFVRVVTASQSASSDYAQYVQRIEDVRTFAGQTVTISFWAKAGSGTPSIAAEWRQAFGTGGSAGVFTPAGKAAITTSWARYSLTVAVPSLSGKTIGTSGEIFAALNLWISSGSDYNTRSTTLGIQNNTFDIWGIQVEAGSTATAFQTATGTIQGELAACQRYYAKLNASGYAYFCNSAARSTTVTDGTVVFPVTMRTVPTLAFSAGNTFMVYDNGSIVAGTAIAADSGTLNASGITLTVASGLVARAAGNIRANNAAASIELSSEL
jgi:hypothetical protein